MNNKIKWEEILLMVGGIIIFWLFLENQNKKELIQQLKNQLDTNEALTEEIKKKLKQLIADNPEIDSDISNELAQITSLIEIKQETKAILSLAKIIENLLKKLYKNNPELKERTKKKRSPSFEDYIQFANEKGVISKEDYHFISVLKIIRNEEAHQLNVKKEKGKIAACFLAGLSITFTLHELVSKI